MDDKPINTMRCPFRTDKDGEFCECYGKACMAYYEYEGFQYPSDGRCSTSKPILTCICRRLSQPVTYGGCV